MRKNHYLLLLVGVLFTLSFSMTSCKDNEYKEPDTSSLYAFSHYGKTFPDLNAVHLEAAQRLGIEPISSREEAEKNKKKLKEIASNDYYQVDKLTHSIPFLVKEADELLNDIAKNFIDSLEHKHISPYQIIVTSVLRTQDNVKQLKAKNKNSSNNSAHLYGTTFDISYVRFNKIVKKGWFAPKEGPDADISLLKSVLAQVLNDLRKAERCYVRYEIRQGCFHITVR